MLTFTQYLTEAVSRYPKVTEKTDLRNNGWLFNHIAPAVQQGVANSFGTSAKIQFAAEDNEKGYQNTRNAVYIKKSSRDPWVPTGITLVTDTRNGTVSVTYREFTARDRQVGVDPIEYHFLTPTKFAAKQRKIVDNISKAAEKILKDICTIKKNNTISTTKQHGYSWNCSDFKYDIKPTKATRSSVTHELEKSRKGEERADTKREMSKAAINRAYNELVDKIGNVKTAMKSGKLFDKFEKAIDDANSTLTNFAKSRWSVGVKNNNVLVDLQIFFTTKDDNYLPDKNEHGNKYVYRYQYQCYVYFKPEKISADEVLKMTPEQLRNDSRVTFAPGFRGIDITTTNIKDFNKMVVHPSRDKNAFTWVRGEKGDRKFPHNDLEKKLTDLADGTKLKDFGKVTEI